MAEQDKTTPGGLKKLWTKRKALTFLQEQMEKAEMKRDRASLFRDYMTIRGWNAITKKRRGRPRGIASQKNDIHEMVVRREATNGREV